MSANRARSFASHLSLGSRLVSSRCVAPSALFSVHTAVTLLVCAAATVALRDAVARRLFWVVLSSTCCLAPCLKWRSQRRKTILAGPWDIAHVATTNDPDHDHDDAM